MMEFAYTLKVPVAYHSKGEQTNAKAIVLKAPSNKQRRPAAKLKQSFFQAINSLPKNEQAKQNASTDEPTGDDIVNLLSMSEVDIDSVHDAFEKLLTSGCAAVDGDVEMTKVIYDLLSFEDCEQMLGEYLVNFLIPSL